MGIWANHAHVFPKVIREDATIEELLKIMDYCDIEKVVAFAPFSYQVKGTDIQPNEWLAKELVGKQDRLIGFGTIDIEAGDFREQVKRIADLGFKGIKLHPPAQEFKILSEVMNEVYQTAEEQNLFLTFHTGVHWNRMRDFEVLDFDEIAFNYSNLKLSLEHVGGYAFFREAVSVIQNHGLNTENGDRGNIFAGLTSVFSPKAPHWYLGPQAMEELVFRIGSNHIIFGLDFPYNSKHDLRDAIGMIRGLNITEEDKQAILGGTLRYLMNE